MSANVLRSLNFAAERLGVTYQRAAQMAREGLLPEGVIVRLGRQIRVDPDALEEFIARGGQALPGGWRKENREEAINNVKYRL